MNDATFVARLARSQWSGLTARALSLVYSVDAMPRNLRTVRNLALQLEVQKPVITRALNSLAAAGVLRRERDPNDGRSLYVMPGKMFGQIMADLRAMAS